MQQSKGICRFLKSTIPALFVAGAMLGETALAQDYTKQMHLSANGQALTLLLQPSQVTRNTRVVDNNGNDIYSGVKTYTGKIKGDTNSWVRLTESAKGLDGVISRFGKRFRLQQTTHGTTSIKSLADTHDHDITLTSHNGNRTALNSVYNSEVTRVARIGIVVDSSYNAKHDGNGLDYALSLINAVDGIYREEFGLALQVETAINIVSAASDPFIFGNVEIETMLRGFRNYRIQSGLLDQNISLAHLFTGNRPIDEPVGLAWIDTACRTDGYDVGLSTPYQHDILLTAHEIAHNLGALHDTETACAASTDKVMWPYISAGTSQQFSSCTVETVKRRLANSCHAEAIDLELALSVDTGNTVHATVRNTDLVRAMPAATLAIDLPEGGSATTLQGDCDQQQLNAEHIECAIGTLAPGADSVVVFQVDSLITDELFASVEPQQYVDVIKHNNSGAITMSADNLVVVMQPVADESLATIQSDPTPQETMVGGNSGTGAMLALPLFGLLALRRRLVAN